MVNVTYPPNNSFVFEIVTIVAEASDDKGITKVEFYIDNYTDSSMQDIIVPYEYKWNTLSLKDSSKHTIFAKAYDTDDNVSSSELITVTINNSLAYPEPVTLYDPTNITDSSITLTWSKSTAEDFNY
ncbi:MAG: Ig-like domain-containing protein [Candidatus Aminicenantia bacterium]